MINPFKQAAEIKKLRDSAKKIQDELSQIEVEEEQGPPCPRRLEAVGGQPVRLTADHLERPIQLARVVDHELRGRRSAELRRAETIAREDERHRGGFGRLPVGRRIADHEP